ncbi:MAG: hypothetical protein ACRCUY_00190 [Thermoguttaceae bacterium]
MTSLFLSTPVVLFAILTFLPRVSGEFTSMNCRSFSILPAVICVILVTGLVIGCSSGQKLPANMPQLTPCCLTIVLDGVPLDGASVSLVPSEPNEWHAGGTSDAAGIVNVYTNGLFRGAPSGIYKVTVQKETPPPPLVGVSQDDLMNPATAKKYANRPATIVVNKKFNNAETTPLTLEIAQKPVVMTCEVQKP